MKPPSVTRKVALCLLALAGLSMRGQAPADRVQSETTVVNDGVPGENSTELRARFAGELRHWQPRFVVIYTGMNDAANDKKFTAPGTFHANVQAMLQIAKGAKVTPVLVAIQPVDEVRLMQRHAPETYGPRTPNERIADDNAVLEELAAREHVALVRFDRVLRAAGGPNSSLSTDGVHLFARGYQLLAEAVWHVLARTWRRGDVVLCIGDSLTYGQGVRPQGSGLLEEAETPYPTYPRDLQKLAEQGKRR